MIVIPADKAQALLFEAPFAPCSLHFHVLERSLASLWAATPGLLQGRQEAVGTVGLHFQPMLGDSVRKPGLDVSKLFPFNL